MPRATLTSKGQITIPRSIREQLGLRAGDRLEFTLSPDGSLRMQALDAAGEARGLRGILADRIRVSGLPTVEQMREVVEEAVAEDFQRETSRGSRTEDEVATEG